MSRLFHARIRWQSWLYLALLLFVAVYSGWTRRPVFMTLAFLALVLIIERIIHTSYRVTDTELIIHTTRFRADTVVPLAAVLRIDRVRGLRFLGRDFNAVLVVVYQVEDSTGTKECEVSILPQNEADFIDYLTRKRQRLARPSVDEDDEEDEDADF